MVQTTDAEADDALSMKMSNKLSKLHDTEGFGNVASKRLSKVASK